MSAEKPTFREVVAFALDRCGIGEVDGHPPSSYGPALAQELQDGLKRAGYSIHRSGECVHPRSKRDDLGRPMTPDEAILVGLAAAGEYLELDDG